MAAGGGAAAAAARGAAVVQALKASGTIVKVGPPEFVALLTKARDPLVVFSEGGMFKKKYEYLFSYKGLAFYTKSPDPLMLPGDTEIVRAQGIWIPG